MATEPTPASRCPSGHSRKAIRSPLGEMRGTANATRGLVQDVANGKLELLKSRFGPHHSEVLAVGSPIGGNNVIRHFSRRPARDRGARQRSDGAQSSASAGLRASAISSEGETPSKRAFAIPRSRDSGFSAWVEYTPGRIAIPRRRIHDCLAAIRKPPASTEPRRKVIRWNEGEGAAIVRTAHEDKCRH